MSSCATTALHRVERRFRMTRKPLRSPLVGPVPSAQVASAWFYWCPRNTLLTIVL